MASEVKVVGSVNAGPSNPAGSTNLSSYVDLGVDEVYPSVKSGNLDLEGVSPFTLNSGEIAAVRVFVFRAVDGDRFQLQMTPAVGSAQTIPCSSLFVLHVPAAGDEIGLIKILGNGRVEYFLAGA